MKTKFIYLAVTLALICHSCPCLGNNVQITNVSITGQNTTDNYTLVEFDISWENSWRVVGGPGNWDAAWVFIKYRIGSGGPWLHAWLNNAGHTNCGMSTMAVGLLNPSSAFDPVTNPGLGVFIYRVSPGSGTFNCQNVQLRWNYGANGLGDNEQVDIKVFAIEQVYVPESAYKVGSGGTEAGHFYTYPTSTDPYLISSEAAITVSPSNGFLYYSGSGDQSGPIPTEFPKGFKAIYVMKYEISQRGYVDFLNCLTGPQQTSRIAVALDIINQYQFVMTGTSDPSYRNSIWTFSAYSPPPSANIFLNNLNDNFTGNEPGDGADIACNYLNWNDLAAYLDWAALRPMTELEYEKCARGPIAPYANEKSWGSTYIRTYSSLPTNSGFSNELIPDTFANCYYLQGPSRTGIMARTGTDRIFSGATYYGALDFSGNVWETIINVGSIAGRSFQGTHGDGLLNPNGTNNVASWPSATSGIGLRGASFVENFYFADYCISHRGSATASGATRMNNVGGRGVRTAPL